MGCLFAKKKKKEEESQLTQSQFEGDSVWNYNPVFSYVNESYFYGMGHVE